MSALVNLPAGARLTAALVQAIAPDAAVKPGDETVTNSSVLQPDNDLLIALPTTGTWAFLCLLFAVSTVATGSGDLKVAWTFPAGASCSWSSIGYSTAGVVNINAVRTASGSASAIGVGTGEVIALLGGTIMMGGTAGDLALEWAQNTASSGQSVTVKELSWLMAWQIA